jgi:hypothetical protein
MVIRGLIERDAGNRLTLTEHGRAALDELRVAVPQRAAVRREPQGAARLYLGGAGHQALGGLRRSHVRRGGTDAGIAGATPREDSGGS